MENVTLKKIAKILKKRGYYEMDVKVIGAADEDSFYEIQCEDKEDVKVLSRAICKKFNTSVSGVRFNSTKPFECHMKINFENINVGLFFEDDSYELACSAFGTLC